MRFADTNVLIYAVCAGPNDAGKRLVAREVLGSEDLCLSAQVLQEFYVQATRDGRQERLSHAEASDFIEALSRFPIEETSVSLIRAAIAAANRWQISYWDAAIVEAARAAGCDTVLTEDLQDGMDFAGVRVVNPFISTSE